MRKGAVVRPRIRVYQRTVKKNKIGPACAGSGISLTRLVDGAGSFATQGSQQLGERIFAVEKK